MFVGLALLPTLLGVATPVRAEKVLVYQHQTMESQGADDAGPNAADILEELGHDVTREISLSAALPGDLSGFDSVWVIQVVPTTGPEETALVEFVRAGGGLYLSGENSGCCSAAKSSIQNVVGRLTPDLTMIANAGEMGEEWVAATDTWGISSTPNSIPTWLVIAPGSMASIPPRNQVYNDTAGDKTGIAAWAGEYLKEAGGCLVVAMDLSFWVDHAHPEMDKKPFAENVQNFLGTCADTDHDGLTDLGEADAGTDAESPDSDGDGLCDGYRAVRGVCIAGESVFANTDADDLVNALDADDDDDGIPTSFELDAELANPDADDYGDPAWLDVDSDNNNIPDFVEGFTDHDGDGIPSIVDRGDDPENCDEDADCDAQPGSLGCNDETGFCAFPRPLGGEGEGGAGNEPTAGAPVTNGGSAATSGGSPGQAGVGSDDEGGRANGEGGSSGKEPGNSNEGGNEADPAGSSNDAGGCGCSIPGRPATPLAALALLFLALARRQRRS